MSMFQKAQDALKYYKGFKGNSEVEINMFNIEFERLKSIAQEQQADEQLHFSDFSKNGLFEFHYSKSINFVYLYS